MSSLSRTYARTSKRRGNIMAQYQPPGAYQAGEEQHRKMLEEKKAKKKTGA